MPVTKTQTTLKQALERPHAPQDAFPLPFKLQNRRFRISLPSAEDDVLDDNSSDLGAAELTKLHRRRSSASANSGYRHVDAYSRFFTRSVDPSHRLGNPVLSNTYLRSNAQFVGEQQSGCARYDIKVEFKSVDLVSSVVTGFFYILGLTDEHPLITTCFKGEIINNPLARLVQGVKKFLFITEEKNWSSFPKNDLEHWKKLTGSLPECTEDELRTKLQKIQAGNDDPLLIYMRWKEEFLLPDSRVKLLTGASFEGFYYVVLNIGSGFEPAQSHHSALKLVPGTMNGLYFYTQSEKFQSLSLRYVPQRAMPPAYTFA